MKRIILIAILLQAHISLLIAAPKLTAELSSNSVIEGETMQLTIRSTGEQIDRLPPNMNADGVSINYTGSSTRISINNGNRSTVYEYTFRLTPISEGNYTIPALTFDLNGETSSTSPIPFTVTSSKSLVEHRYKDSSISFTYYSLLTVPKTNILVNESIPVNIKYYIPSSVRMYQWGTANADTENMAVWRFNPPTKREDIGQSYVKGKRYSVASLSSVATGLKGGPAKLGPIKASLSILERSQGFGSFFSDAKNIKLTSSVIDLDVKLPPTGAPASFQGDIGQYSMETSIDASKTTLTTAESIGIDITISGKGNLKQLSPPIITDEEHWNLISAQPNEQGDERKKTQGSVTFKYLLNPRSTATSTPNFEFSFYDPVLKKYTTHISHSIPITVTEASTGGVANTAPPAITQPQSKGIPNIDEMQDILTSIRPVRTKHSTGFFSSLPHWWWHVIPALILLSIIGHNIKKQFMKYTDRNAERFRILRAHKTLSKERGDATAFLKSAGQFIETWLSHKQSDEISGILKKRDELLYQPTDQKTDLSTNDRKKILTTLKRAALSCFIITIASLTILPQTLDAQTQEIKELASKTPQIFSDAVTAEEKGEYQKAIDLYNSAALPSADSLFNTGNSYYRLGQPGMAALFYHRALAADENHREAHQNLRFLAKTYQPTLASKRNDFQKVLSKLNRKQLFVILIPVLSLIVLICALVSHYSYPKSIQYAPVEELAVVTPVDHYLYSSPITSDNGKNQISPLNPSTLCKIIAKRGNWTYIELPNLTRGWVKQDSVTAVKL